MYLGHESVSAKGIHREKDPAGLGVLAVACGPSTGGILRQVVLSSSQTKLHRGTLSKEAK